MSLAEQLLYQKTSDHRKYGNEYMVTGDTRRHRRFLKTSVQHLRPYLDPTTPIKRATNLKKVKRLKEVDKVAPLVFKSGNGQVQVVLAEYDMLNSQRANPKANYSRQTQMNNVVLPYRRNVKLARLNYRTAAKTKRTIVKQQKRERKRKAAVKRAQARQMAQQ